MLRNAEQTHRNHDIVPSILFVHRIVLMKREAIATKTNGNREQSKKKSVALLKPNQQRNKNNCKSKKKRDKNEQPNRKNPNKMLYEFQFGVVR